ncbi:MAG: 4-hydroxy-tetrahydrodipicolinate reductase [Eubacterium sp.]|jgi:4-hydroxy-tetrahydrodipicolinate reductase|nr:4-hydroxy-tetrahydrodipicolinate reductase [Eubacterium sp.]
MKIIVIAPKGKMGRLVTAAAADREGVEIIAGIAPAGRDYIGTDIGEAAGLGKTVGALVTDDLESVIDQCDAIIDFSTVEQGMKTLAAARAHKKALLTGTTGFSDEQKKQFEDAAADIPVMLAANTSMQVNLLYRLLEMAAKAIGGSTDIEVVDMHDRNKLDAPSGTANEIGEVLCQVLGKSMKKDAVYGHVGEGRREDGSIAFHSIRGGDWPSSHTVYFIGSGERLEITHHAVNWKCFAEGAVTGALYLTEQKPGAYTMQDCLGL